MKIEYYCLGTIAHKYTFQNTKIRLWVKRHCRGKVLNLFAGKTVLSSLNIRVDMDASMPKLTYVGSAEDYLQQTSEKFDTIIFDPPWNERKAREIYNGNYIGKFQRIKEDIVKHLNPQGRIISAGYKIRYFGKKRGFDLTNILICDIAGDINPFFITIEQYPKNILENY